MCDDNKNKALLKIFGRLRPDPNDPNVRIIQRYEGNSFKNSSSTQKKKKSKSSRRKDDSDSSVEFPRAHITKSKRTLRSSLSTKPEASTFSQIPNKDHSYCKTSSQREDDSEIFTSKYETDTDDEAEETQQQQEPKVNKFNLNSSQLNLKTDTNTPPKNSPTDQGSTNSDSMSATLEAVRQNQAEKKNVFNREYNDSYLDEFDQTMFGNLFTEIDLKDKFGAQLADETYMPIIDVPHSSNLSIMQLDQTLTSTISTTKDPLLTQVVVNAPPLSDTSSSTLGSDSSPICLFTAVSPPQQPTILPITTQPKTEQLPLTKISSTSSTTLQSVQRNASAFPSITEILSTFPFEMESINPQLLHDNTFCRDEGNFPEVDMYLTTIIKTIAFESEDRPSDTAQPIDFVNTQHQAPSASTTQAESFRGTSFQTNTPLNTSEEMMLYPANRDGKKQVPANPQNTPNIVETPNLQNLQNNPEEWATLLSYLKYSEQNSKNTSTDDINEVVPLEDTKPPLYLLQKYSSSTQTDASTAQPSEPMNTASSNLNQNSTPFRNLCESSSDLISVSDLKISPSSVVSWSGTSQHSTGRNFENYNSTSKSNFSTSGGAIELISSITPPKQPTPKNRYPGMSIAKRGSNSSIRSLSPKIETIKYCSDEEQNCRIHLVETPPPFSQEPPQNQLPCIRDYRQFNGGRAAAHSLNLELQPAQSFGDSSSKQKQIYGTTSSYDNTSFIRSLNQKTQLGNIIKSFEPQGQQLAGTPNDSRLIPFQYQQGQQVAQTFKPPPRTDIPIFCRESQGDQTFRNPPSHYSKSATQSFPQDIKSATPFMQEPQPAQNYGAKQSYNTKLTTMPTTGGLQTGNTRTLQSCDDKPTSQIQELQYIETQLTHQIKSETTFPPEIQLNHTSQPYHAMPITSATDVPRPGQTFGTLQSCDDKLKSHIQGLQTRFPSQAQPIYTLAPSQPSTISATDGTHTGQTTRAFQSHDGGIPQSGHTLGNQPSRQIRVATSFTPQPQPAYTFVSPQSYQTGFSNSSTTDRPYPGQTIGTYQSFAGGNPQSNQILGNQPWHQSYHNASTTTPHTRQTSGTPLTSDRGPTPETIILELQLAHAVFDPRAYNQRQNFGTPQLYDDRSRPVTISQGSQSAPSFMAPRSYNRRTSSTSVTEEPYPGQSFAIPQANVGRSNSHTIIPRPQSAAPFLAPQSYTARPPNMSVADGPCAGQSLGTPQLRGPQSAPSFIAPQSYTARPPNMSVADGPCAGQSLGTPQLRGPQSAPSFIAPQSYNARPPNMSVADGPCAGQSLGTPQLRGPQSAPSFIAPQSYNARPSNMSVAEGPCAGQSLGTPQLRGPQSAPSFIAPQSYNARPSNMSVAEGPCAGQSLGTPQLRGPQSAPSFIAPQSYNARPSNTSDTEAGQSFGARQSIDVRSRFPTTARESQYQSRTKELPQSHRTKPKRTYRKTSEKKSLNSRVKYDPRHREDRSSRNSHQHSTLPDLNRSQNPQFQNASRSIYMMERNTRVSDECQESSIHYRSYQPQQTLPTPSNFYQSMDPNFSARTQISCIPRNGYFHGYSCQYIQNPGAPIYNQQMQPTSKDIRQASTDNSRPVHEPAYNPTNHTIHVLDSSSDGSPEYQY